MRFLSVLMAVTAFGGTAATSVAATPSHVQVRMLADVKAVKPGDTFRIGLLLNVDPHWHIYWENPGDSGEATSIKYDVPTGFHVHETIFPVPARLTLPGGIVNYGYENRVLLIATVDTPANLDPHGHPFRFAATINWLACSEEKCVPGSQAIELTLPVSPDKFEDNQDTFASKSLPQFPVDCATSDSPATCTFGIGGAQVTIKWKQQAPRNVEFFPAPEEALQIKHVTVQTEGDTTAIRYQATVFSGQTIKSHQLRALIAYDDGDGVRQGVYIAIPLESFPAKSKP